MGHKAKDQDDVGRRALVEKVCVSLLCSLLLLCCCCSDVVALLVILVIEAQPSTLMPIITASI